MRPRHLMIAAVILLFATTAIPAIDDCYDATCRISTGDARGTGCVFEISNGRVFVLTNAHVVGNAPTVYCEFWRRGYRSSKIAGIVLHRNIRIDAAIVSLPAGSFADILPLVIPLAGRDYLPQVGETIASVGCAKGAWATGLKGHVVGHEGIRFGFVPPPANGRSGSAIFDAGGTKIIGLLHARTMDNSVGYAISAANIHRAIRNEALLTTVDFEGGIRFGCPGGICPVPKPKPQAAGPWPGLQAQPGTSSGVEDKLDTVIGKLNVVIDQTAPAPLDAKTEPKPSGPIVGLLAVAALVVGGLLFYVVGQN